MKPKKPAKPTASSTRAHSRSSALGRRIVIAIAFVALAITVIAVGAWKVKHVEDAASQTLVLVDIAVVAIIMIGAFIEERLLTVFSELIGYDSPRQPSHSGRSLHPRDPLWRSTAWAFATVFILAVSVLLADWHDSRKKNGTGARTPNMIGEHGDQGKAANVKKTTELHE